MDQTNPQNTLKVTFSKAKKILNQGSNKYSDEQIQQLLSFLRRIAELEVSL